jgi:hypothetical protein
MKYQGHSDTSYEAALEIEPSKDSLRAKVYSHIILCGLYGATDEELQLTLNMAGNTERPRRIELVDGGHVIDSNYRRKTKSGRDAVVWIATRIRARKV